MDEEMTFEQLAEELKRERAEKQRMIMRNNAEKMLRQKQLPEELADFMMGADEESTQMNIDRFSKCFSSAVASEVRVRLAGAAPEAGRVKAPVREEDLSDEEYYKSLGR